MNQKPPQPADPHASAQEAYAKGNLPLALELYRKNLDREPNNLGIICRVGELLLALNRSNDAIEFLAPKLHQWPENLILNNLIATAYIGKKDYDLALRYLEIVLRKKGQDPVALTNKGIALEGRGHLALALKEFKKVWLAYPNSALACANYGGTLSKLNKLSDAIPILTKAVKLNPKDLKSQINLAKTLQLMGGFERAAECYIKILESSPKNAEAIIGIASCERSLGNPDAANTILNRITSDDPRYLEAKIMRGNLAAERELFDQALAIYAEVLEKEPPEAEVLLNRAQVYTSLRRFDDALEDLDCYASLAPPSEKYWVSKGVIAAEKKDHDLALIYFHKAKTINTDYVPALLNLGHSYMALRDFSSAIECFEQAIRIKPGEEVALWHLGLCHLHQNQYMRGWPYFEFRPSRNSGIYQHLPILCKQNLSAVKKKTLLAYAEGGFGSTIQFARFVGEFASRFDCLVTGLVQHELVGIFEGTNTVKWQSVDETVKPKDYAFAVSMLSLPYLLGADLNERDFLEGRSFLKSTLDKTAQPAQSTPRTRKKVGICWRGSGRVNRGTRVVNSNFRDMNLSDLSELIALDHEFFSLQLGIDDSEKEILKATGVKDLGSGLGCFNATRTVLETMDVVVTVDTALAHLSGSLGLETHVLIPYEADWRWGVDETTSLWYPSVRLHRCKSKDTWLPVVFTVSSALA